MPVKPGGIVKLRSPRNWSPSSRSRRRVKFEKAPATGFDVPATRRGSNGRDRARARRAAGAGVDADDRARVLRGEHGRSRG